MATETVTRRIIELDVKTSSNALREMKAQAEAMRNLEKTVSGVTGSLKNLAIGFASAFTAREVFNVFRSTIDMMDAAKDTAEQLALTVPDLQQWQHAAEMSGASAEDLAAGIRGMSKSMADMGNHTATSTKALEQFGVRAADSTDTALTKIAEGFAHLEDGPRKAALAMDVFGKAGAKLLPLLNSGAEGLEQMRKEAIELGIAFSDDAAAGAASFNDDMDRLRKQTQGFVMQITTGMVPALQSVAGVFVDAAKDAGGFVEVGRDIGEGIAFVTEVGIKSVATLRAFGRLIEGVKDIWNEGAGEGASAAARRMISDINQLEADANKRLDDLTRRMYARSREFVGPQLDSGRTGLGRDIEVPYEPKHQQIDKDVQALERFIKAQQDAVAGTKEMNAEQQLAYMLASGDVTVKTQQEKALYTHAEALAKEATMRISANDAVEEALRLDKEARQPRLDELKHLDELREGYLDLIDPLRKVKREQEQLSRVIEATTDSETRELLKAHRLALQVSEEAGETWRKMTKEQAANAQQIADEIKGYAGQVAGTLVNFASGVENSFSDMVKSILSSMAQLLVQQQLQPMFDNFARWASGTSAANGEVFGPRGVQAFASGGVVSSPTFFGMAGGGVGLMGEAGPEAVVPLKRTAQGDLGVQASPVVVNIINNNGSQVKTEEATSPNGQRELRVMIDNAVTEGMGSGRYDRVMSTTYGVTRRGR